MQESMTQFAIKRKIPIKHWDLTTIVAFLLYLDETHSWGQPTFLAKAKDVKKVFHNNKLSNFVDNEVELNTVIRKYAKLRIDASDSPTSTNKAKYIPCSIWKKLVFGMFMERLEKRK